VKRIAVRVRRADAEIALAELLELVPAGVEEVDHGETIEYALYGAADDLPDAAHLRAAAGAGLVGVTTTEVGDDWGSRWRTFHHPVTIGERLHVRAPWHDAPADPALLDIVIDPAQAFGTGAHHTTRLCLEALLELDPRGPLVDLGCGSGVLAIAACKLGWDPVLGVDHEPESVDATRENAAVNGVTLEASHHDIVLGGPVPSAATTVANLLRPLLLHVAAEGFGCEPPRVLIVSGLLAHEADEIAAAFARRGLREHARRHGGEWAAMTLVGS
jgi:ribosomal protein L11 methyltransferase